MLNDLRFAFRQLMKAPAFSIAAVAVLALGIGVNTAIFSLVNALLFSPPPYKNPAEIVQLFSQDKKDPKSFRAFSYPTFSDVRAENTVFSGVMAHSDTVVGLGEKGNTRRAHADLVSSDYFSVLGVQPAYGRSFLPEEEKPGRPERVAIVSYRYWKKYSRDPALLGHTLFVNGQAFTVVGIMPEGLTETESIFSAEVWLPLGVYDEVMNDRASAGAPSSLADRGRGNLMVIGRLKPGLTVADAEPALKGLAANLETAFPVEQKDQTFMTAPLDRFSSSTDPSDPEPVYAIGLMLSGMAGVVLLVACLNLANMLLARGTARRKEMAIRLALGGSRGRIVRQLLTEGFMLALLGGVGGLILGLWSIDLLAASFSKVAPFEVDWLGDPNPMVLAATLGFCVLGTLGFALGPALKLSRTNVGDLKQQAGEDVTRRRWRFLPRNPLIVAQIAFSLALLTAAALFIRSATTAASIDSGLRADNTFLIETDASLGGFDQNRAEDLYRTLRDKFAALPGVERASISATVPFGTTSIRRSVQSAGTHAAPGAKPATAEEGLTFSPWWNSVGADYFATVGLPLLRGRAFTEAEATQPGGPAVAIIDEDLAKKMWPNGDALGQQIQFPVLDIPVAESGQPTGEIKRGQPIEIIGIVPRVKNRLFDRELQGAVYLPFARGFKNNVFFFVKFASLPGGTETATADLLRKTLQSVDPVLPVFELRTFENHMDHNPQLWLIKAAAALFSVFGGLALGLSVVGIYGIKAYAVARRTREIGIRMALGAEGKTVQWMILREGFTMVAAGLAIGLLLAFGTGKIVSSILFEVSARDPFAFTIAPVVLALAALLATWLPARRATRISPMAALRTE